MSSTRERNAKSGSGDCNGSFGEILQGVLPGNKKFLINLKIKNKSKARVTVTNCRYSSEKESAFIDSYRRYSKTYKILRNILSDLGYHNDVFLEVESNIPIGKGLSSSTADMVAGVDAIQRALSISLKKDYISRMVTEIEPNDGLHYEGSSAYHHTLGRLIHQFDYIPPLHIMGIDLGGEIDTVKFNARAFPWTEDDMQDYAALLEEARTAYEAKDAAGICAVATKSALKWQKIVPKPFLDRVLDLARETGALGVVNTHSGTFLGLAYGQEERDIPGVHARLLREFPGLNVQWFQTVTC